MKPRSPVALNALAWAIVVAGNSPASAQSLEPLRQKVKIGTALTVTDTGGHLTKGVLREISPSEIVLEVKGAEQRRHYPAASIVRVERRDSKLNGLLIGMGVAVGGGLVYSAISGTCVNCEEFGYVSLALLGGGAGIGVAVDSVLGPERIVFEAPEASPVAPKPVASPRSVGLVMKVSF